LHEPADLDDFFIFSGFYDKRSKYIIPQSKVSKTLQEIMGKIYSKLGILTNGTFKKVTRSDLIAGYLGQTALKTKDVINEALGGVLFIDEAYSLGNEEGRDSFAKECIDTINQNLSDIILNFYF
jgi:hypothetical protein